MSLCALHIGSHGAGTNCFPLEAPSLTTSHPVTDPHYPSQASNLPVTVGENMKANAPAIIRKGAGTLWLVLWIAPCGFAQVQNHYTASSVTGQLVLTRTVNLSQIVTTELAAVRTTSQSSSRAWLHGGRFDRPEALETPSTIRPRALVNRSRTSEPQEIPPGSAKLTVNSTGTVFGFNGISHYDQRNAAGGNQFSIEPPSPSIAVANGFVLEGVNNAIRIFSTSGTPLVGTIASNQLFGLSPAIDRTTNVYGPYLTDMRVYFDQWVGRWFVMQRSQDNDSSGTPLNSSHLYLAVSQSTDPTAAWNIYVMDTTDSKNRGCPCLLDYPQIGSDQFGLYISANEYDTTYLDIVDTTIMAISKAGLATGQLTPSAYRFNLPMSLGYEFAIQPSTTPPSASNFIVSGGVEYFVSSQATYASDNNLAIWALSNTASLQGVNPSLLLTETNITLSQGGITLSYLYPNVATQPTGPLPLGSSIETQPQLPFLDGGPDSRVQSVTYAGGRLYVTLPAQVRDDTGTSVVGGLYVILSPTFRSNLLSAVVVKQGYLFVRNNHVLRPSISVDASGRGAIGFTLVGPDYYPSAAYTTFVTTLPSTGLIDPTPPSTAVIAGIGALPEDGFTGYPPEPTAPIARWGDYSTAVTSTDGSIWFVAEYVTSGPRTPLANWATFIYRYMPVPAGVGN